MQGLNDLLASLRAPARREKTVEDELAWLRAQLEPHDLRVTAETPEFVPRAPAARRASGLRLAPRGGVTLDLRSAMRDLELAERNGRVGRVIISRARREPVDPASPAARLVRECNGVVLLPAEGWRVLVLPPRAFTRAGAVDSEAMLKQYSVYAAEDGTVVTLYKTPASLAARQDAPEGAWAVATAHAFDASQLPWFGSQTYARVIHDALARYPEFVEASGLRLEGGYLVMPKIDGACCYSIGFRSAAFHPPVASAADREHVWQILHARTAGQAPRAVYQPGLPALPTQRELPPMTLHEMRQACAASVRELGASGAPPCFGFSLRARDRTYAAQAAPDVLIESQLLDSVRELMYTRPLPHDELALRDTDARTWYAFMAFRALLSNDDGRRRAMFAQIYGAREQLDRMRSWVALVEACVLARLSPADSAPSATPSANTAMVADALVHSFKGRHPQLTAATPSGSRMISEFVVSLSHVLLYALGWIAENKDALLAEPAEPVEPAEPAEPAEPVETALPAETSLPVKP